MEHAIFSKTIVLLLLLFQFQKQVHCLIKETRSFGKNFSFTASKIMLYSDPLITDDNQITVAYLKCDSFKYNCIAIQEIYRFDQPAISSEKKSCRFDHNIILAVDGKLIQFSKDWLIADLTYYDYSRELKKIVSIRTIMTINMMDCKTHLINAEKNDLFDDMRHLTKRKDGHLFDVFYMDFEFCKSGQYRVTYDIDGRKVEDPVCVLMGNYPNMKMHQQKLIRMITDVPISNETYFAVAASEYLWAGYLLRYDSADFKEIFYGPFYPHFYDYNQISTGYDRITVCWVPFTNISFTSINCSYMDLEKKEILLNFPYNISSFMIYNMPKGDFLALTSRKQGKNQVGVEIINYDLWRFRSDGSKIGEPTEIGALSCGNNHLQRSPAFIEERNNGEICIIFGCKYRSIGELYYYDYRFDFNIKCLRIEKDENENEIAVIIV